MSRSLKKFLYGALYVGLLVSIAITVYLTQFESEETCFDGIKNQTEEDTDCGGPCALQCNILRLVSPQAEPAQTFSLLSGKVVLLAKVKNPNTNYGIARFMYSFNIYGDEDALLETVKGAGGLYPGEEKYLYTADVSKTTDVIRYVRVEFSNIEWKRASEYIRPVIAQPQNLKTEIEHHRVRVSGLLANQSALAVRNIFVLAFARDKFGNHLFPAQTFIDRLNGFSEKEFLILFPQDEAIISRIDPQQTEVFVNFE